MSNRVEHYETIVFDCDGVILDSNHVKSRAFYRAALPYGEAPARALVDWHVANGGISRYEKFAYFLDEIVPRRTGLGLSELLDRFSAEVRLGLASCQVAPGLAALRNVTSTARWLIVSGGDQAELREVFASRGLAWLFDRGIFGSPDSKDTILAREIESGNIRLPGLYLGDSTYDHRVAVNAGLDFVFVSGWSELADWKEYVATHGLRYVETVADLIVGDFAFARTL